MVRLRERKFQGKEIKETLRQPPFPKGKANIRSFIADNQKPGTVSCISYAVLGFPFLVKAGIILPPHFLISALWDLGWGFLKQYDKLEVTYANDL